MAKEQKKQLYSWQGLNQKGQKTTGEMEGQNAALVKALLRKQGISPISVKKKAQPLFSFGGGKKKITSGDITIFIRQMATMMKAGVPLVQSFDIVADGLDNLALKELVGNIKNDVAAGNDFASVLKKHPLYFDELTCNLIESGEQSGALETMLDKVAIYKEKSEALKKKLKKAMTYPTAVMVVAFIVTGILLIKVVPTFEELFAGFGADLPGPTKMVISISEVVQAYYLQALVILGAVGFTFSHLLKTSKNFRDGFQRFTLKLPVVGDIVLKASIARFGRVLSTTFAAGVPLIDALHSVAGAVGNAVYRDAVLNIKDEVSSGTQLNFAMKQTNVFPNMVVQMVSIGEESGALDAMLDKAAVYYEDEVDAAVDGLTALMEPIIMSFLAVVIGGLIIAMYMPIFQMGDVV